MAAASPLLLLSSFTGGHWSAAGLWSLWGRARWCPGHCLQPTEPRTPPARQAAGRLDCGTGYCATAVHSSSSSSCGPARRTATLSYSGGASRGQPPAPAPRTPTHHSLPCPARSRINCSQTYGLPAAVVWCGGVEVCLRAGGGAVCRVGQPARHPPPPSPHLAHATNQVTSRSIGISTPAPRVSSPARSSSPQITSYPPASQLVTQIEPPTHFPGKLTQ